MHIKFGFPAAAICLGAFATAHVAGAATYGSASYATYRDCSTTALTAACDGNLEPDQRIVLSTLSGGALTTADSSLVLNGQPVNYLPGGIPGAGFAPSDGSFAQGTVGFGPGLDLPVLTGSTQAYGNERMNINSIGYQSYDYSGPGEAFSLTGQLDIQASSTDGGTGVLPNGAIYTAYVAIWEPSVLAGLMSAGDIFNNTFLADCGTSGVLGVGTVSGPIGGGPQSFSVSTSACGGGSVMLTTGEEVIAVAGLQLPVNRGGFASADDTFALALGPGVSADGLRSGESILSPTPEPATWAMMLTGFFGLGSALRRRRAALAV